MGMLEAFKGMGELVKRVHDASLQVEMQQKILDVQNECLALQEKLSELQGENDTLNSQIAKLRNRGAIRKKIHVSHGCYRINDELGDRCICGACYEGKDVTIPLARVAISTRDGYCTACNVQYPNAFI